MDDGLLQILAFIGYLILANMFRAFRRRGSQGSASSETLSTEKRETTCRDFRGSESNGLDGHWSGVDDLAMTSLRDQGGHEEAECGNAAIIYRGKQRSSSFSEEIKDVIVTTEILKRRV